MEPKITGLTPEEENLVDIWRAGVLRIWRINRQIEAIGESAGLEYGMLRARLLGSRVEVEELENMMPPHIYATTLGHFPNGS